MLLLTAQAFLMDEPITHEMITMDDADLMEELQLRFQSHLERYYEASGIKQKVVNLYSQRTKHPAKEPLDEGICNIIAENSQDDGTWALELPAFHKEFQKKGYNCTLGSALLQTALEDAGMTDARTVLRAGHYVVMRELDDGSIKILDATSVSTVDKDTPEERLVGYARTFPADKVTNRTKIAEPGNRSGTAFTLCADTPDAIGGFTERNAAQYEQHFYANPPSIKINIAIALENLSEIKDDARKANQNEQHNFLAIDAYRQAVAEYILSTNAIPLHKNDLRTIERENFQPFNELVDAANRAFEGSAPAPNPYDFLQSSLLKQHPGSGAPPDPRNFVGSSEKYQEAKMICDRFPQLYTLDFATLKKQFGLFNGYDHLHPRTA